MGYRRIANATSDGPQIHFDPWFPFVGFAPEKSLSAAPDLTNRKNHRLGACERARTARLAGGESLKRKAETTSVLPS